MSRASKITLALAVATSAGIIGYVHFKQSQDRDKLHEGVVRDIERQQRRKMENTYVLQKQIDLTKQLKTMEENSQDLTNQTSQDVQTEVPLPVKNVA